MSTELMLKPSVEVLQGQITLQDKDAIKGMLNEIVMRYEGIVVTTDEDSYKEAKKQRAELNKIISAIEDKRKECKKLYLTPLEAFENDIKDILTVANTAKKELDGNIKAVEALQKEERMQQVLELIKEHAEGYQIELRSEWLNKSVKVTHVVDEIKYAVREAKQAEEQLKKEIDTVSKACETGKLEPSGYIKLLESGVDVLEVLSTINSVVASKQEQPKAVEVVEEQPKPVEVVEEKQEVEKDVPKITNVIEVTGTVEQLNKLNEFCKANGIGVKLYAR